jgi:signal transduction histidine kinase
MRQLREAGRYLRHVITTYHSSALHLAWWHTALPGYLISILLVALVVLLIRVLLIREVHFLWIPFCLVSVLVGSIWGVSPALLATLLGFLAFNFIIIPQSDILTFDVWEDLRILGPFVLAQFGIALLAAQSAVKHRRVLLARQELNEYALQLATLNRQLEQTNQDLEKANRLKEDFMTRAAHELRTPLTTILGETQLALRRLRKQEQPAPDLQIYQHHFTKIEARAHGLRALIEDLIVLSGLRSGEAPLRHDRCDFGNLCREVVEDQRALSGRQIELRLPSSPTILQADEERLFQVVVNLISNAIHYSRDDTIIHVCIRSKSTHVLFQVHNAGPPLSPEQQAHLFEPFYRTPYAETQLKDGWGLGLPVSKEIVERHGGHIRVQSTEKHGTTFFVQLPF